MLSKGAKMSKSSKYQIKNQVLHISKAGLNLVKDGEFISVKDSKSTISKIHPNKLKAIIINTTISLKSDVLFLANDYKIPVTFINQKQESISLYKSESSSKTLISQAKLSDETRLNLAKQIILTKCKNQRNYIKRINKYHKTYKTNIANISANLNKIKSAKSIQELLAYEGGVALWYFDVMVDRFSKYNFTKRHKKGAKDVINMSLNYLYSILYSKIQKLMIDNALSPYVGIFHTNNDKNPSLVYDFIEEYRVWVVDMVVFGLFSHNPCIKDSGNLSDELKAKLSKMFSERLQDKFIYEDKKLSIEEIMQKQVKKLKLAIVKNIDYKGFCPKIC